MKQCVRNMLKQVDAPKVAEIYTHTHTHTLLNAAEHNQTEAILNPMDNKVCWVFLWFKFFEGDKEDGK